MSSFEFHIFTQHSALISFLNCNIQIVACVNSLFLFIAEWYAMILSVPHFVLRDIYLLGDILVVLDFGCYQ